MAVLLNQVRRTFYMDSVALMRISRSVSELPGVVTAALMIGSATNKTLMRDAGLLDEVGEKAGANDLVLAVRAQDEASARGALKHAEGLLDAPVTVGQGAKARDPKSLDTALQQLPGANLALISVPGEFAAAEARRALAKGLHVMLFSDNVSVAEEVKLKQDAKQRGLLVMGPDCGTAIINGIPLAFANAVPPGDIGIVAASGTGLQEVSTLIARQGRGISQAIGVGGRDLKEAVGGIMTLMAIDALDRDAGTTHIVIVSKPPEPAVAKSVLERVGKSRKRFSICFIGGAEMPMPANATFAADLRSAAEKATGGQPIAWRDAVPPAQVASAIARPRRKVRGLFSGGTMCAEAQVIFRRAGLDVVSNAPIPGVGKPRQGADHPNVLLDLGEDEYTVGRPHPMIDPSLRNEMLRTALADEEVALVLLDVVIGYGSHPDPAGDLAAQLAGKADRKTAIVASVCGTESDPQVYSRQVQLLQGAGVIVAPSNAHAAELVAEVAGEVSKRG